MVIDSDGFWGFGFRVVESEGFPGEDSGIGGAFFLREGSERRTSGPRFQRERHCLPWSQQFLKKGCRADVAEIM